MNSQSALSELRALIGRTVELRFKDGHVVRVHLIDVDLDSTPNELIYDILEVLDWGAVAPTSIDKKAAVAANAVELDSWKLVG